MIARDVWACRIAPLPPHWVVNVVAPHLGIGVLPFWASTFFGIMGVTVIHTTIGGELSLIFSLMCHVHVMGDCNSRLPRSSSNRTWQSMRCALGLVLPPPGW